MVLLNTATKVYSGSTAAKKVYLGSQQVWTSAPAVTGPTSWLNISYTPGSDRNDFNGEVGVRWGIGVTNISFTWMGARCLKTGDSGTRKLNLYEWFSSSKVATATIDFTGKNAGEYAWVQVPQYTMLANGYYALLMEVSVGMQVWANPGPTVFNSSIVNIYDSYKDGTAGALSTGLVNSQFIGVDVGWN